MNVAFFHGLETDTSSDSHKLRIQMLNTMFDTVYVPTINYKTVKFDEILKEIKDKKIDMLVGSSMGGWYAYCLSTVTGLPTLLFNPALKTRSFEPDVKLGSKTGHHMIILGEQDDVVPNEETVDFLSMTNLKHSTKFFYEKNMGHRTPNRIFFKFLKKL